MDQVETQNNLNEGEAPQKSPVTIEVTASEDG